MMTHKTITYEQASRKSTLYEHNKRIAAQAKLMWRCVFAFIWIKARVNTVLGLAI